MLLLQRYHALSVQFEVGLRFASMSDRAADPSSASAAEPSARRKVVRKQNTRTGLKTPAEVANMHRTSAAAPNAAQ